MFNNEEQFARLIGGLDVNAEPDPKHRERIREQMLSEFRDASIASKPSISTWPSRRGIGHKDNVDASYWRTLMSSRLSRYAAVAAVAAVIILGLTFFGGKTKKGNAAWAIEQTFQALQNVRSVYSKATESCAHMARQNPSSTRKQLEDKVRSITIEGWAISEDGVDECKARMDMYCLPVVNESGEAATTLSIEAGNETRSFNIGGNQPTGIMVKRNNAVYQYAPGFDQVGIQGPDTLYIFHPWPGTTLQSLLEHAKNPNAKWQEEYGRDTLTGRDSVFVKYVGKNAGLDASFWYEFDVESKLPVRMKAWDNTNWEGEPDVTAEMVYNIDIPDDTFNFPISVKALQVTDRRENTPQSEKSFTIEVPGGTCKFPEIVEDALKAKAEQQTTTEGE